VSASRWKFGASLATGAAVVIGVIGGVICVTISIVARGQASSLFLILGLTLPGLLLQDTWRYSFVAARRTSGAFVNDTICALLLLPMLVALVVSGDFSVPLAIALWGGASLVAALVGIGQAGLLPKPLRTSAWWHGQADLAPRYLAEFAAVAGESQVVLYGIAVISSLAAVAAIRGGLLLLGPLNILVFGATMSGVPEAVRLLRFGTSRLVAVCVAISASLVTLTAAWAAVLLIVPSSLGTSLVGPVWHSARPLIPALAIATAALGVVIGGAIGLRALEAAPRGLRTRLIVSPVILGCGLGGAAFDGALGGAWGLAIGQGIAAIVFWHQFMGAVTHRTSELSQGRAVALDYRADVRTAGDRTQAACTTP
jgi:hypothetical protein